MICSVSLNTELKPISRDLDIFKLSLRPGPSHVWILWAQNVWSTSSQARLIRPTPRLWTENNLEMESREAAGEPDPKTRKAGSAEPPHPPVLPPLPFPDPGLGPETPVYQLAIFRKHTT